VLFLLAILNNHHSLSRRYLYTSKIDPVQEIKAAKSTGVQIETSDIVMSVNSGEDQYADYKRDRGAEEKLLDHFRDPKDPLKIIIVTSKLLTGFDAPLLQTMCLDKPLRDHTLLQANPCRR
tara:strand:- start:5900 stop:6262 length:363 start_codon:yes stop_codon:yes gene_type:complete